MNLLNIDCKEYMKTVPNKFYSLAVCDPPYGSKNIIGGYTNGNGGGIAKQKAYNNDLWQQKQIDKETITEIIRVSKNQIFWGANHYASLLPFDSPGWIVWDKENGNNSFSDVETAWTSFNVGARLFRYRWNGMLQGNMKKKEVRIHPTQKPAALYEWILRRYAAAGDTIFDPFLGSGTIAIACNNLGFDLDGCEISPAYYEKAMRVINLHLAQTKILL